MPIKTHHKITFRMPTYKIQHVVIETVLQKQKFDNKYSLSVMLFWRGILPSRLAQSINFKFRRNVLNLESLLRVNFNERI